MLKCCVSCLLYAITVHFKLRFVVKYQNPNHSLSTIENNWGYYFGLEETCLTFHTTNNTSAKYQWWTLHTCFLHLVRFACVPISSGPNLLPECKYWDCKPAELFSIGWIHLRNLRTCLYFLQRLQWGRFSWWTWAICLFHQAGHHQPSTLHSFNDQYLISFQDRDKLP